MSRNEFARDWRRDPVERLALYPEEAARRLGCSRDFFDEHILPELRVVRRGRRMLIPMSELQAWLQRSAERTFPGTR